MGVEWVVFGGKRISKMNGVKQVLMSELLQRKWIVGSWIVGSLDSRISRAG